MQTNSSSRRVAWSWWLLQGCYSILNDCFTRPPLQSLGFQGCGCVASLRGIQTSSSAMPLNALCHNVRWGSQTTLQDILSKYGCLKNALSKPRKNIYDIPLMFHYCSPVLRCHLIQIRRVSSATFAEGCVCVYVCKIL